MTLHRVPTSARVPSVSVVVPCYRYGHYVEGAVQSALDQGGVEVEVIVVDDASPDDSGDVVRQLSAEHPQVAAVVHETNRGHIATYDHGLGLATGEYVLLLSADDLLAPGALARATAVMDRYPSVGLVYGFAPDFEDRPPPPRAALPHCTVWTGDRWLERVSARGQNPVCTPTAVMRRDLLEKVGGYDADLPHTADLLMWLRAAAHADVAYLGGVDQAYYRVHGANMHSTDFAALDQDVEERSRAFRVFAAELGDARGTRYLGRALNSLAAEAHRSRAAEAGSGRAARLWRDLVGRADWHYWRRFGLRL